jgi:DNA-binding response OmpR family regulator
LVLQKSRRRCFRLFFFRRKETVPKNFRIYSVLSGVKILIIEDEPTLAASMTEYLSGEQYLCETAATYREAMDKISLFDYDCIVLDLMLPGGDGMHILQEIKSQQKRDGVIIVSAKDGLDDKIKGLQIGADDYLAKPFHLPELAARIYSVIRRRSFDSVNRLVQNELVIDLPSKTVSVHGQEVSLTRKEYDLLLYFLSNRNRVISKAALAEHLSGELAEIFDSYDVIYAHVKNLKRKLTDAGCRNYLRTVYGSGYKWEA